MALFGLLTRPDINVGVAEARQTPGALLLDVRTKAEYDAGHIAGSRSFPLDALQQAPQVLPDKSTPLFVYCLSGGRSRRAAATLKRMGYTNVKNIGGITGYTGKAEG